MTTSTMVERVAAVLNPAPFSYEAGSGHGPGECVNCDEERETARRMARAAIEAMVEPTDEMLKAGELPGWDDMVSVGLASKIWDAMLRSSLKEPTP